MKSSNPITNLSFRKLFAAQIIALVGTGLSTVGLSLLAYNLAGELNMNNPECFNFPDQSNCISAGSVLGIALACKMIAYVFFAPIVGGLAHRFARKPFLISLDVTRAFLVLLMPFVYELWHIYLLIFLLNFFSAGFKPVFQAVIPDILEDDVMYGKALSYSRLAYDLENLLSPTLAAIALFYFSYTGLFAANSIAFVISAAIIVVTFIPLAKPVQRAGNIWDEISYGIIAYFKTPRLRSLLILYIAVASASAMVIVNTIIYVKDYLGGSDSELAIFFAASGFGSMLAALSFPTLSGIFKDRTIVQSGTIFLAAGLALMATEPAFSFALYTWFVIGVGLSLVQTPSGRIVNVSTTPSDRSSFFSAQFALSHLCWLIAYPVVGQLVLYRGFGFSAAFLACIILICFIFSILFWPTENETRLTHKHKKLVHSHTHGHEDAHHLHQHNSNLDEHSHEHEHKEIVHKHEFVIDLHHQQWPKG